MSRVIITGASRGIGAAVVHELSARHSLVLVARDELKLNAIAGGLPNATVLPLDLRSADWDLPVADVLVHCAGAAHFGPIAEMSTDALEEQIDLNLTAFARACRAVLPAMLAANKGHIVGVFSIAAVHAFPQSAAYCASKAGALMFARSLAAEVRSQGVRVTSVLPGATDTPLWDSQPGHPPREKMLSSKAVAEAIAFAIESPGDRSYDEIRIVPPDGIL